MLLGDRYELDALPAGRGGMGEVWLGRDRKLDRPVAVKIVRLPGDGADEEFVRRFVRESRITARLEHPGVPSVYDVGTHDERPFMVMERVVGITVSDLVAEHGPLPIGWAAAIAAQTCAVLVAAHTAGLVHRDLKPANLMLRADGAVKVLDFGLAVALGAGDSQITRTGQTLGTPAYMAPELVLAGQTTSRADLYALGCTLYEMLTGRPPFRGGTTYSVMSRQVEESPVPVRVRRGEIPADLDALVDRLLAKDPADRPADAQTVAAALAPHVDPTGDLPDVLAPPGQPSPIRLWAGVLARVHTRRDSDSRDFGARDSGSHRLAGPSTDGCSPGGQATVGRADLIRARGEAASLARRSQYDQAARVLTAVLGPASATLGPGDVDVLSLRFELARLRFDAADYRGASPLYRDLARDVATHRGAVDDLAVECRRQEATCNALSGRVDLALDQLRDLIADLRRAVGPDDGHVLDLRAQFVFLLVGVGRPVRDELTGLLADATRILGPDHPTTAALRGLHPV